MMKILFFIALLCTFHAAAQAPAEETANQKTTLGERGLNRFFFDGNIGAGLMFEYGYYPQNQYGIVSNFRIGNNFYLGKGNNPMIIRLTYLRLGFVAEIKSGAYIHIVPPQLGLVKHCRLNETLSIEPGIHVGYIFAAQFPPYSGIGRVGFAVVPEIKFNINKLSLGVEYGTRKDTHGYASNSHKSYGRYHYFGFSIGMRFGRGF